MFYYYYYFFNVVLTWKIVGASKASVLYIYIDLRSLLKLIFSQLKLVNNNFSLFF